MHCAVKFSMDHVQSCWASPIRYRNKRTKNHDSLDWPKKFTLRTPNLPVTVCFSTRVKLLSQIAGGKCSIVQKRSLVPAPGCSMEKGGFTAPGEGRIDPSCVLGPFWCAQLEACGLFPQPSFQEEAPEPELRVHSSLLGGKWDLHEQPWACYSVSESCQNKCINCKFKLNCFLCNFGHHILLKDRNMDPFTK